MSSIDPDHYKLSEEEGKKHMKYHTTLLGKPITYDPNKNAVDKNNAPIHRNFFWCGGKKFIMVGDEFTRKIGGAFNRAELQITEDGKHTDDWVEVKKYDQILIQLGEWMWGANWTGGKFIVDPEKTPISDAKEIERMGDNEPRMKKLFRFKHTNRSIKDMEELLKCLGFKPEQAPDLTRSAPPVDEQQITEKKKNQKKNFRAFQGKHEDSDDWKNALPDAELTENQKYVKKFYQGLIETKKSATTSQALVNTLYRVCVVNGIQPLDLVILNDGSKTIIQRDQAMKKYGVIFQHWNQTHITKTDFFKLPFNLYGVSVKQMPVKLETLASFLDDAEYKTYTPEEWDGKGGNLPNGEDPKINKDIVTDFGWNEDEKKYTWVQKPYATEKKKNQFPDFNKYANFSGVKQAKHAMIQFTNTIDHPKQWMPAKATSKDNWFFRGVPKAKHGDVGGNISDQDVKDGMEFLQTGKIPKARYAHLHKTNPEEYPDKEDKMENHYNPTLAIYKEYGLPYGDLAPANMFLRLAMSGAGWRRAEGLTATTLQAESLDALEHEDFGGKDENIHQGIYFDKDGFVVSTQAQADRYGVKTGTRTKATYSLAVKFFTRKTLKWDVPDHTVEIPAFSSDLIDTKDTINLVLRKANIGQIHVDQPQVMTTTNDGKEVPETNPDGSLKRKIIINFERATEEQKKKWHKKKKFYEWSGQKPTTKPTVDLEAGEVNSLSHTMKGKELFYTTMIGYPNQFIKASQLFNDGYKDDQPISFNGNAEKAYLAYPLREMYAMMEGTRITRKPTKLILREQEKNRQWKILVEHQTKVKPIIKPNANGFADIADAKGGCKGCKDGDIVPIGYQDAWKLQLDVMKYEYTHTNRYWIEHSVHSIRHLFAQTWLRQTLWDYAMVADMGHWEVIATLKDNYGSAPRNVLTDKVASAFARSLTETDGKVEESKESVSLSNALVSSNVVTGKIAKSFVTEGTLEEIKLTKKKREQTDQDADDEQEANA